MKRFLVLAFTFGVLVSPVHVSAHNGVDHGAGEEHKHTTTETSPVPSNPPAQLEEVKYENVTPAAIAVFGLVTAALGGSIFYLARNQNTKK